MGWLVGAFVSVVWAAGPLPDVGQFGGDARSGGFSQVLEPRVFEFPQDHGPHPEYRQEWWYVTGNLDSATGERFGFELTFFRFALAPEGVSRDGAVVPGSVATTPAGAVVSQSAAVVPAASPTHVSPAVSSSGFAAPTSAAESSWRTGQIYMAHFAITDVARQRFRFTQKLSRGAVGLAGATSPPLQVWIDDWSLGTVNSDGTHWRLRAAESGYELTLDAQALQQPVLNGDKGLSQKSSDRGSASYYYSIPRVSVRGRLVRDGQSTDVQGLAWVDREWGSGALGGNEQGWDWFALQLQDGASLMFYALRDHDGRRDSHSAGTWIGPAGQSRPLSSDQVRIDVLDYWKNPGGDRYPAHWRVRVPSAGIDVDVRPVLPNQELIASTRYWEGAVDVTGASAGQKTAGRGYVELVGYAAQ
jgi:predicted secreted hydrolase